eukprot:g9929.t1
MLSTVRQARGPCRREAQAAWTRLANKPGRQHTAAGLHLLHLPARAASSTTPPPRTPSLARPWRNHVSSEIFGGKLRGRRALASSATTRGADNVGVEGKPEGIGYSNDVACDGVQEERDSGALGFPEFSDHAEDFDFVPQTEGEESASDVDEINANQSAKAAAAAATDAEDEADDVPQAQIKDPSMMRLSRRIARSGIASRREAERLVEAGVVTVNGTPVKTPALNVGPRDIVKVKGKALERPEDHTPRLWMVHKTRNELVTRHDPEGRATVFDRLAKLKMPDTLMPVGRLDYNTEGLLLLTNDGDLARLMELPSSNIVRTYSVRVYGNITEEKLRAMRSGCTIEGVRYKGMFVRVEGGGGKGREGRNAWLTIECTEGKNRQIRKICKYLCLTVNRLARTRYGPFTLGKVRAGGVARVEIPKGFLRRLEEGTAGGSLGAGGDGGSSGGGRRRAGGPGPGTGKRREAEAGGMSSPHQGGSLLGGEGMGSRSGGGDEGGEGGSGSHSGSGGGWGVGGTWGGVRGKGPRIRKGVGAPMSRGDNSARSLAQRAR